MLGIGMGGFLDGILLHQIFQWHNMLSTVLPPATLEAMHTNMLWDGLFHGVVWMATLVGIFMIWSEGRRASVFPPAGWLIGLMLMGWGSFNLIEGTVNHHVLGIHHVREWGPNPGWDYGFLLSGPLLFGVGWFLTHVWGGKQVPTADR
jgi:uncharacterized membrane protein